MPRRLRKLGWRTLAVILLLKTLVVAVVYFAY